MAAGTRDLTTGATTGHPSRRQKHTPYVVRERFTAAAAVALKGSALEANEIMQCLDVPADTVIIGAGVEVLTADSGTTLTADLGITGGDVDIFVDGIDLTTVGKSVMPLAANNSIFNGSADTIDLKLITLTAPGDDWVVEVWAIYCDVSAYPIPTSAKGT